MPTTTSPVWNAPQAGLIGDAAATAGSAQVNQFLTTHADTVIYQGNPIVTPNGAGGTAWAEQFSTLDIDQPFTMSGTAIGRVAVPLLPVGNGADLLVSLCADNAGTPGTVITQTRIPASWISQLSVVSGVSGPSSAAPAVQYTGNPLAVAQHYSICGGTQSTGSWALPAGSDGSYIDAWAVANTPNCMILLGGLSTATSAAQNTAFTIAYTGTGQFPAAIPQPAMPATNVSGAATVQTDPTSGTETLILLGGLLTSTSAALSTVYAAQFNSSSGAISSWSAQTPMGTAVQTPAIATSGQYVYSIGGNTAAGLGFSPTNVVQFAQVQNGQISSWSTTTPLPAAMSSPTAVTIGNIIFVSGPISGSSVYCYAYVNANGTLGPWITAPGFTFYSGLEQVGQYGVYFSGARGGDSLSFSENGPDVAWQTQNIATNGALAVVPGSAGQWQFYTISIFTPPSTFTTYPLYLTPRISVPLPATGLTNSATYHVLLQQQGGDPNNYLRTHTDTNVFPGNPTLLTSSRGAYTWTAATSGTAVPLQVFDNAGPAAPGLLPWHTWADKGARVQTIVCATTPDRRLLGICEATRIQIQRNANSGFESGIAPWFVSGATVLQSSTQVYEGQYSAQITPSGSAANVYIGSENIPCMPGQSITVNAWLWFTNSVSGNTSVSINWYASVAAGGGYISTSSNDVSAPAATWTQLTNTFTAPAGAYQYSIAPTLSGTPASSNVFYVDQAYSTDLMTPQQSTVTALSYPSAWPGGTWPPLGSTVLA